MRCEIHRYNKAMQTLTSTLIKRFTFADEQHRIALVMRDTLIR